MKNKNLLWVVAGAGLGVVAFYLFCKKEVYETIEVVNEDGEVEKKSVPVGGGGGGGFFAPSTPVSSVTPVALTTAIPTTSINIVPTSPTPTTTTPAPTPTTAVTTTMAPTSTGLTPTTSIPPSPSTPPKVTGALTPVASAPLHSTASSFSGFNGGGDSFEVGECLKDLF